MDGTTSEPVPGGGAPAGLDELAGRAGTWLGRTDAGAERHTAAVVADRLLAGGVPWRAGTTGAAGAQSA